jgi:vacuolar-type H+-ATPase subunit B/Vma2
MKPIKNEKFAVASLVTITLALSFAASGRPLDKPKVKPETVKSNQVKSMLPCERIGAPSDVVRTMRLTNDTGNTLAKGKRIYWSTSDGEKGSMLIPENLPKGQSLRVYDNIGQYQYTCEAWIFRPKLTTTK